MLKNIYIAFCVGLFLYYKAGFCFGTCGNPIPPQNGEWKKIGKTEAQLFCNKGYKVNGNLTTSCVNGQWSFSGQFCSLIQDVHEDWLGCGTPGNPENGSRYIHSKNFKYTCDKNFILIGARERSCQPDGTWTPPIPKCVRNLAANKSTVYEGYKFRDNKTLVTDGNRTSCENERTQFHLIIDFEEDIYFDTVHVFYCNNITISDILNVDSRQMSIFTISTSDFKNSTYININHLRKINSTRNITNQTLQLSLEETAVTSYLVLLFNLKISICEINVMNLKEKSNCGRPDQPLHGKQFRCSLKTFAYECNNGYSMAGKKFVNCKDGVWDNAPPKCQLLSATPGQPHTTPTTSETIETRNPRQCAESTTAELNNDGGKKTHVVGIGVGVAALILLIILSFYILKRSDVCQKRSKESSKNVLENVVHKVCENDEDPAYEVLKNPMEQIKSNDFINVENEFYDSVH